MSGHWGDSRLRLLRADGPDLNLQWLDRNPAEVVMVRAEADQRLRCCGSCYQADSELMD
jgi:hypothetical protein